MTQELGGCGNLKLIKLPLIVIAIMLAWGEGVF